MCAPTSAFIQLLDSLHMAAQLFDRSARPQHETVELRQLLSASIDAVRLRAAIADAARRTMWAGPDARIGSTLRTAAATYALSAIGVPATVAVMDSILVVVHRVDERYVTDGDLRERYKLTPREIEIVRHLASGLPNDQIARLLGRSPYTVRRHTEHILAKLDIRRRAQVGARLGGGAPWESIAV